MQDSDFTIALQIRHPDIDPDKLTESLALTPEHCWRAGEQRRDEQGAALDGVYRESFWIATLDPVRYSQSFEGEGTEAWGRFEGFASLSATLMLAALTLDRRGEAWREVLTTGGSAEILIQLHGRSARLDLPPMLIAILARLGVAIAVDVQGDVAEAA